MIITNKSEMMETTSRSKVNIYSFELEDNNNNGSSLTFMTKPKEFTWLLKTNTSKDEEELTKKSVNWGDLVEDVFR